MNTVQAKGMIHVSPRTYEKLTSHVHYILSEYLRLNKPTWDVQAHHQVTNMDSCY